MNDIEIKKEMYKEFEKKDNIINIKDELFKSMQSLKEEDLTHSNSFRLEDTMSAFVINHFKMDPHSHNEKVINIKLNKENNLNNKKNIIKYSEFINKTISFPKKPESTIIKKRNEKDLDEEPLFTESNFNTKNNNISLQDNSTKLSVSTNIKTFGDKNTLDSNISNEINNKIIFNLEDNNPINICDNKDKEKDKFSLKLDISVINEVKSINEEENININLKKNQINKKTHKIKPKILNFKNPEFKYCLIK